MKPVFSFFLTPRSLRAFAAAGLALALAACGGGGGSPGTTIGTTPNGGGNQSTAKPTITLELVDSKGAAKNAVTMAGPLTARATVKDAKGQPVANTIVAFGTGGDLTVLSPGTGRALTNASGVATVTLGVKSLEVAQSQGGAADALTAAVSFGQEVYEAKANFSIGATAISLRLVTPSTNSVNLKAYDTTPIKVEVLADGVLYTAQPVTVNFSSACAPVKADLPSTATTINGAAQVVYRDKGCSSTDTVTASVPGATSVTASLVVAPPVAASIGFVSGEPADKAIVIKGAGGNGRSETAVLTFQALDTFGQPLPNQLVTFSVNPTGVVSLQSTSATTGADGKVIVAVNSGTVPTTFRVIARLPSGQETISDTITVTTGQPEQRAFSIGPKDFNIEGWNIDNQKTTVTALLADKNGNPVADGTPVVFQTNSGAIGSAAVGGCLTVNGGCTVDFRSQEPRTQTTAGNRIGVATITASSTSATTQISGKTAIFLSGGAAQLYFGGAPLSNANRVIGLTSCAAASIEVEVFDQNLNPMPVGSKVEGVNADKVAISNVLPSTVPNISPPPTFFAGEYAGTPARWGSSHVVVFKPDAATCNDAGTPGKGQGTFGLTVSSPSGLTTLFTFVVRYPAT